MTVISDEDLANLVSSYEKQSRALKNELIKICWFMRGGVTWNEALSMGSQDRELIAELIKDNLETTKKTGLSFF